MSNFLSDRKKKYLLIDKKANSILIVISHFLFFSFQNYEHEEKENLQRGPTKGRWASSTKLLPLVGGPPKAAALVVVWCYGAAFGEKKKKRRSRLWCPSKQPKQPTFFLLSFFNFYFSKVKKKAFTCLGQAQVVNYIKSHII